MSKDCASLRHILDTQCQYIAVTMEEDVDKRAAEYYKLTLLPWQSLDASGMELACRLLPVLF